MDFRICQTPTASPAEPGGLPLTLGRVNTAFARLLAYGFVFHNRDCDSARGLERQRDGQISLANMNIKREEEADARRWLRSIVDWRRCVDRLRVVVGPLIFGSTAIRMRFTPVPTLVLTLIAPTLVPMLIAPTVISGERRPRGDSAHHRSEDKRDH
jgi:hypothetical protein